MLDMSTWLPEFTEKVKETFGDRIVCIGLQGSYSRGESGPDSGIDVVVILDKLSPADIKTYESAIDSLPSRDKIRGFISGKQELLCWEPSDLFQFYYDTMPVVGNLDSIVPLIGRENVYRAIRIGGCRLYRSCVRNMLHKKDLDSLKKLYKAVRFILQAQYYVEAGIFLRRNEDLMPRLTPENRDMLETSLRVREMESITPEEFDALSQKLFLFAGKTIRNS